MIAAVEPAQRDDLDRHSDQQRGDERQHRAGDEAAGPGREGGGEIGAHHVERTVRQVHQVHDAEDQRQPGREQEQQQPELQAVQALFDEQQHGSDLSVTPSSGMIRRQHHPTRDSVATAGWVSLA